MEADLLEQMRQEVQAYRLERQALINEVKRVAEREQKLQALLQEREVASTSRAEKEPMVGHTATRRDLSFEHNPSTSIKEVIELLANNLSDWMAPRESTVNANNLQKLMSIASGFERSHKKDMASLSFLPKKNFSKKAGSKTIYTSEIPDRKVIKADTSEGR